MNQNRFTKLNKDAHVVIKLKLSHLKWIMVAVMVILFIYAVLLNNVLSVPLSTEWMVEHRNDPEMLHSDSAFVVSETTAAIFHQFSIFWEGPIHNLYAWASIIITISAFLWASLFCFITVPKGFRLREDNLVQHMIFSAVLASISSFQILQSLRNDPENFFWVPWLILVLLALTIRAYCRIHSGKRTLSKEIMFHIPWIIGLAVPHLIWFEPFHSMNQGTPIELPFSGYFVNAYTIVMNIAVIIISLGFIPEIQYENKKEIIS